MNPWMISAPEVEPVSLAEAAEAVGGADGDDGFLLSSLLVSARVFLEGETGCLFVAQKWGVRLAPWPTGARVAIPHPIAPVIGLEAVRVENGGIFDTLDPAAFAVDDVEGAAMLSVRERRAADAVTHATGGVVVDLAAGFGPAADAVPAPLRRAVLELAAHWFEHREPISFGRGTLPVPTPVRALIAPYCRTAARPRALCRAS